MTAPLETGVVCIDIDQMLAFYVDVLGLKMVADARTTAEMSHKFGATPDGYRIVRLQTPNGERVKLVQPNKVASKSNRGSAFVFERQGTAYISFVIADIQDAAKRLKQHGGKLMSTDPVEVARGLRLSSRRIRKAISLSTLNMQTSPRTVRIFVSRNSLSRSAKKNVQTQELIMDVVKRSAILAAFALFFLAVGFGENPNDSAGSPPPASIPTFSTENMARQGHFYVGGKWVGEPGKQIMRGAMYVEVWVPKKIRHPYPIVFMQAGGGQTNIALLQTPDGRPGWAYDFLNQGYTVYMMDFPGRARAGYDPAADGAIVPPRSGELMEEVWTHGRKSDNPMRNWPTMDRYSQWVGPSRTEGKMGEPEFDYFAKTEVPFPSSDDNEQLCADDVVQLLDMINQPVILLLHSRLATSGWLVADERPKLVKAILAPEPWAPPIENHELDARGPGRRWGLTNFPVHYDPPIKDASELQTVQQETADGPGLVPCWIQKEPARKLINLEGIPVLNVSGEASYHRPYAHCVAKWLNQAGVKTEYHNLEDLGMPGNGHQMMSEKNSAEISKYFMDWLDKNVH